MSIVSSSATIYLGRVFFSLSAFSRLLIVVFSGKENMPSSSSKKRKRPQQEPTFQSAKEFVTMSFGKKLKFQDRQILEAALLTVSKNQCIDIVFQDGQPGLGPRVAGHDEAISYHGTKAKHLPSIVHEGKLRLSIPHNQTLGHYKAVFTSPNFWTAMETYTVDQSNRYEIIFPGFVGSVVLLGVYRISHAPEQRGTNFDKIPGQKKKKPDKDQHGREKNVQLFFFRTDLFVLQRVLIYCHSEGPLDPDLSAIGFKFSPGRVGIEQNKVETLKEACKMYFAKAETVDMLEQMKRERIDKVTPREKQYFPPNPKKRNYQKKHALVQKKIKKKKKARATARQKENTASTSAATSSGLVRDDLQEQAHEKTTGEESTANQF